MRHKRSQFNHERFIKILEKEKAELESHSNLLFHKKNDSNESSNSPLVPETGLEPARREAYAPKAYVYTNFTTRAC